MAEKRLLGIQAARGVAALLVVLYHAGRGVAPATGSVPLGGAFDFGHAGVDFFFVLSGFIIAYVHRADIGVPAALPRYAWRRLTRIYPVYWLVTAGVLALALLKGTLPVPLAALPSALLLLQEDELPLGVAWTLVHEMFFYAVFALAILWRPLGVAAALAWVALLLARLAGVRLGVPVLHFAGGPINMDFLFGIAAAEAVRHVRLAWPRLLAVAGAAGFLAAGLAENAGRIATDGLASKLLFGLAAAAIVLGLAAAERQGRLRVGRAAVLAGNASYSLYLLHTVVIGLTARVLAGLHLPGVLVMAIAAAAAVAAGLLLYEVAERPVLRWAAAYSPQARALPSTRQRP